MAKTDSSDAFKKVNSTFEPLTSATVGYDSHRSIAQKRKETPVIRHLIAIALGSLFPPSSVFLIRNPRVVDMETVATLPDPASSSYGPSSRNSSRRHIGASASVAAASARMNIPRGVHRDSYGSDVRAARADSVRKPRSRNGSRK